MQVYNTYTFRSLYNTRLYTFTRILGMQKRWKQKNSFLIIKFFSKFWGTCWTTKNFKNFCKNSRHLK